MTALDDEITITVEPANKRCIVSGRMAEYENVPVSIGLSGGEDWPAGAYTLALTFFGRPVATAGLSRSTTKLSGNLNLATTEIEDIFDSLPSLERVFLEMTLWDATNRRALGKAKVGIMRTNWIDGMTAPTPNPSAFYTGTEDIEENADTLEVDISGLGLTAAPAQVFASVECPAGGFNVAATLASKSAAEITFSLTAEVGENYKLHWMVIP